MRRHLKGADPYCDLYEIGFCLFYIPTETGVNQKTGMSMDPAPKLFSTRQVSIRITHKYVICRRGGRAAAVLRVSGDNHR